jgi:2'-5' RNA ligase
VSGAIRSFVALDLPEGHLALLSAHLDRCGRLAPGFRWVAPDGLHLTLRFLGELDPAPLERVSAALARVRCSPFQVRLGEVGTFGPGRATRVVWLGVSEGLAACRALAGKVEAACRAAGLEADEREFQAHVTLARARANQARLPPLPELRPLPPWTVEDFVLYESRLRERPRYLALGRYRLSGAAG